MNRKINKTLLLLSLCLLLASCSFSYERIENKNYGKVFAATKTNINALSEVNFVLGNFKYIFILDLPFSLITDIVILPYDLYAAPEYEADREFWDNHFSTTNTAQPDYTVLSNNYSEYGARIIFDRLGREYLKHHPEYAIPFINIAADNMEIERSDDILSKISSDWQVSKDTMVDVCTLSISNIDKYKVIIIGYINNRSTPSSCLHDFARALPSSALSNNRHQVSLLRDISNRLQITGDPTDLEYSYLAAKKADELHKEMQIVGTVTSIDSTSRWVTINSTNNECIAVLFSNTESIQVNDQVSGEFKDSGGSKAFNRTKNSTFNIYVPYTGDESENTAKRLCI